MQRHTGRCRLRGWLFVLTLFLLVQARAQETDAVPGGGADELSDEELKKLEGEVGVGVKVGADVFDEGVEVFYKGDYVLSASILWDYLAGNQPGAKHYGYAEFFLAQCFDRLGLTHVAMEYYYNVAKNRTKPELLQDALGAIERMTRKFPFDQELILKDLIYDTTFGYVRDDLNDFLEFYQGYLDYQNGFVKWGEKHFSNIKKGSYYYYRACYVRAVYELVKHNLDEALKLFQEILDSDFSQADVINNTRQSVARIFFEKKEYEKAYAMYETIDSPIEKQASVFLEEAWTQYYLKNYQRAMGLLYALEAPAFYRYFNPEKFLIKALIYQNLCHYNVAKDAVAGFRRDFGDAIDAIYQRVHLEKDMVLLDAALQEPVLAAWGRFQKLLDTEMGRLNDFSIWRNNGLVRHLERLYDLKIREVNRYIKQKSDKTMRNVANRLLEFEEQMNLLEYEIGLSIYKRIKGAPVEKEASKFRIPMSDTWVYYKFDGEFWNDELHDFQFFIEDRCFSEERWE